MGHRGKRPVVAVSEASIIIENTPLQRNWRGTRRSRSSLRHLRTALRRAFIAPVIAEHVYGASSTHDAPGEKEDAMAEAAIRQRVADGVEAVRAKDISRPTLLA